MHPPRNAPKVLQTAVFVLVLLLLASADFAQAQTFTLLYSFGADGEQFPIANLAQGRDGSLYGTTFGDYDNPSIPGSVFKITADGTFTRLYMFDLAHGFNPRGLTLGRDGNFYGTTEFGGAAGFGTAFRITSDGSLTVLHDFQGGADGGGPFGPPLESSDGNFYGTTSGWLNQKGTIYRMTPTGQLTTIHKIPKGALCVAPLTRGAGGSFLGTVETGGSQDFGMVFRVTPDGDFSVLHNFDQLHGAYPYSSILSASNGSIYGTAFSGSPHNDGVVFRINPSGSYRVVHKFLGRDGEEPSGGLLQATDGNIYGATLAGDNNAGEIFQMSPSGVFAVVHNFDGLEGGYPEDITLVQRTDGMLYGVSLLGGDFGLGTVYSINIGQGPFVSLVTPAEREGASIGILGQGLLGTTQVSFDGLLAVFTVVSDTYLEAVVPGGALTGPVRVTMSSGVLNSNHLFYVLPFIDHFSPSSGGVGTPVIITGTSFTQTTKVRFGGVAAASFSVDSDTQVTAIVPPGAKTGKIVIRTHGGHAKSATDFTVTP